MSSPRPPTREERSAGGVVLRWLGGEAHALLIRDPYGNWGLPKGHLEAGEEAVDTAVREVREETGLDGLEVGPDVGTIDWYFRRPEGVIHKFCTFFVMRSSTGDPVPELSEGITECVWVPIAQAVERVSYDNAREPLEEVRGLLERRGPDGLF